MDKLEAIRTLELMLAAGKKAHAKTKGAAREMNERGQQAVQFAIEFLEEH